MPIEARRILAVFIFCFVLLALQLGFVAILQSDRLGQNPRNPRLVNPTPGIVRGGILARNGEVIGAGQGILTRVYPVASLCHLAGYADPRFGASGLEAAYDRVLSGLDRNPWFGAWLGRGWWSPRQGANVETTIDLRLQRAAAAALGSRTGAVAVIDAANGDVLALVSRPGFTDPPTEETWLLDTARRDGPFLNRALQGLYPPGSAGKIITAAAALRAGLGSFAMECDGQTVIGGRRIRDAEAGGHGMVDLHRALAVSCNVYFAHLGIRIDRGLLVAQAKAFGLGESPPLPLPVEAGSYPWPVSQTEQMEASIGEGRLLVTPLQMALAVSALVNGGRIARPRLVRAVIYPNGVRAEYRASIWRRAISAKAAALLEEDLVAAVRNGTGRRAAVPGIRSGGKTGTAEAPGGRPHAWFVGFAEIGERRLAIAAVVEHGGSGGLAAAPIAAEVWRAAAGGARD